MSAESEKIAKKIAKDISVSIHIRRGDYISDPKTNQYHGICSPEYYNNAVKYVSQKIHRAHFYIFSDDINWAANNFKIDFPMTFVGHNSWRKGYDDMRLIGKCKHHVTANSSFSWWGAWLCSNPDKIVISPLKWFNDSTNDTKDLIPCNWVRL